MLTKGSTIALLKYSSSNSRIDNHATTKLLAALISTRLQMLMVLYRDISLVCIYPHPKQFCSLPKADAICYYYVQQGHP